MFLNMADSAAARLQCAVTFNRDKYPAASEPLWRGERYAHDRIRVAYLSADFRQHPMAYSMAGVFDAHDRSRFKTIAISFGPDSQDPVRRRLETAFDCFRDVRTMVDRDIARLLRELEVDIAVDLMGYTNNSRPGVLAFRPAPVQVNYIGFAGTLGAEYIDYLIADRFVVPEVAQASYAEQVVYLPDTYWPTDDRVEVGEPGLGRAESGLPEDGFVFCCFNQNYKIAPPVFEVWMNLLRQVDGSVLWLVRDNADAERNLRQQAEDRGIVPQRLVFAPRVSIEEYLARFRLADLFLDTLPFNAHTTAADALWAGLPLVTCPGSSFAARVAGSLLTAVGLPELITTSLPEYEALALSLAREPERLTGIRAKLVRNRGTFPLFDTNRFTRHIESAYRTMWERYQQGEPPAGFAVAPLP
jgi:predicted O-linked N-acetylglucosamine transferase (SPINDLY family)